jgi:hypothetical protein
MTYEQGGSGRAGLAVITQVGDTLSLADRVAHHVTTGLSTVETSARNAQKLVAEYQKFRKEKTYKYNSYVLRGTKAKVDPILDLLGKNKIEWQEPTAQSMLIKIDNTVMVIYSAKVQTFRVITYDGEYNNGVKRWYCSDEKGLNCYLYISPADSKTNLITIGLEYDDLAYYYRGRQE